MKIQNKIVPLSLILLFIVGIYGTTHQSSFSFDQEISHNDPIVILEINLGLSGDLHAKLPVFAAGTGEKKQRADY